MIKNKHFLISTFVFLQKWQNFYDYFQLVVKIFRTALKIRKRNFFFAKIKNSTAK